MDNNKTLYAILGVARDASQDAIKQAYKTRAQRHHPDKNGGQASDDFIQVKAAYEVLSDQQRREEYDCTGNTTKTHSINVEAKSQLLNLFKQAIETSKPHEDITDKLSRAITQAQADILNKISGIERKIGAIEKNRERVTWNGDGINLWSRLINQQIGQLNAQNRSFEHQLAVTDRVKSMLSDYEFKVCGNNLRP